MNATDAALAGLLADICAHPADDALRLIYADACWDAGRLDRAEFVRLQVEIAAIDAEREASGKSGFRTLKIRSRYESLQRRAIELQDALLKDWWDDYGGPGITARRWTRGFVSELVCTTQHWLDHGPRIVQLQPVERVRLKDRHLWESGELFAWMDEQKPPWDGLCVIPEMIAAQLPETSVPPPYFNNPTTALAARLSHWYRTREAALDALARAAVRWARLQAGLPALP